MKPLSYHQGDEMPSWQATISINGDAPDFSVGWTFTVTLTRPGEPSATLTKTSGIAGSSGGRVEVTWFAHELDLPAAVYNAQLTGESAGLQWTIDQPVSIYRRVLAEAP